MLLSDWDETHRLLVPHLTVEYRVKNEGRPHDRRREDSPGPERQPLADGGVRCAVAALMQGFSLPGPEVKRVAKARVGFAALQRKTQK